MMLASMPTAVHVRPATTEDARAVAEIYNHGIAERQATFETRARSPREVAGWLEEGRPFLVATATDGTILGFARLSPYSVRKAYAGIGEHGIYVDPRARGKGVGKLLLDELAAAAEQAGYHKLTSRVFTTNQASLALHRSAGFTEVGIQRRHGRLDGEWKDTMLVERLLGDAAR
jgi:phosphinothricin acetyltransferase